MYVYDHSADQGQSVSPSTIADTDSDEADRVHSVEGNLPTKTLTDERRSNDAESIRNQGEGVQKGKAVCGEHVAPHAVLLAENFLISCHRSPQYQYWTFAGTRFRGMKSSGCMLTIHSLYSPQNRVLKAIGKDADHHGHGREDHIGGDMLGRLVIMVSKEGPHDGGTAVGE